MQGLDAAIESISSLEGVQVSTGWDDPVLATRALFNEYGTEHTPARPAMQMAVEAFGEDWTHSTRAAVLAKAWGDNRGARKALQKTAHNMLRDTQYTYNSAHFTPNAPSTIRQKGSSRPLRDTGELIESLQSFVELP